MVLQIIPRALTIAGSDSGGGAGIQADLRTFAFHAVHGMSALTCLTAQNTLGVQGVVAVEPHFVERQVRSVIEDIGVDSVKTGMLLNAGIVEAVARLAIDPGLPNLVVDPVMVSRTGVQLIADEAIAKLKTELLPLARIVTPNRYEAQILAQMPVRTIDEMEIAARRIAALGCPTVLVKGGGMEGAAHGVDVLLDQAGIIHLLKTETIATPHTHGTGCTLAAAICARLARGHSLYESVVLAKTYVTEALRHSLALGRGQGPVGHFYPILGTGDF